MTDIEKAARIGSLDKNRNRLKLGDVVIYYAGSRRDIRQEYVVEPMPLSLVRPMPPPYETVFSQEVDIFRALGHDGQLQDVYVRLFEFETWGEILTRPNKE